jgi:hypothetical protein
MRHRMEGMGHVVRSEGAVEPGRIEHRPRPALGCRFSGIGVALATLLLGIPVAATAQDPCLGKGSQELLDCSAKLRSDLAGKLGGGTFKGTGAIVARIRALAVAMSDKAGKESNTTIQKDLEVAQQLNNDVATAAEGAAVAEAIGKIPKPLTAVLFSPSLERNSYSVRAAPDDATRGILVRDSEGSTAGVLLAAEAPLTYTKLYTTDGGRGGQYLPVGAWFGVQLGTSGGQALDNVELAAGISLTLISKHSLFKILEDEKGDASANPARLLLGAVYGAETHLSGGLEEGDEFALGQVPPTAKNYSVKFTIGLGFRF